MATTAVPEAPVQPALVARAKSHPTWFRIEHSTFEKKSLPRSLGIDAEFCKYTSSITSSDTDILLFWEVRLILSNGTMTHLLNRLIRKSFPLYLRLPWTT